MFDKHNFQSNRLFSVEHGCVWNSLSVVLNSLIIVYLIMSCYVFDIVCSDCIYYSYVITCPEFYSRGRKYKNVLKITCHYFPSLEIRSWVGTTKNISKSVATRLGESPQSQ